MYCRGGNLPPATQRYLSRVGKTVYIGRACRGGNLAARCVATIEPYQQNGTTPDMARPPCLSLWERWPSTARTERVNVDDTKDVIIQKDRTTLSVTCGDSSPIGRAKGPFR